MSSKSVIEQKAAAIAELWMRGEISWKLKSHQKDLYNLFYKSDFKTQTWLLSRRSGKSFTLCMLAIEACLKNSNTVIKFLSPTRIQVTNNIRPLMREILEDCPIEIKPEFKTKDSIYYFKNGSEIQLAGSESGNAEKLRGGYAQICIVDEAQDVTDLNNVVKSVLLPTTLTTNGKIILAGTPPKNPDHDFIKFVEDSEFRGSLVRKTVYDDVMLTPTIIEEIAAEVGGYESEEFRREFMCEIIKEVTYSVIPEFDTILEQKIVKEWPKPAMYHSYEAMDLGFTDLTGILFAYYDFRADKIIIEDELVYSGSELTVPKLVQDITHKEETLWLNLLTNEVVEPKIRVSDINYIVMEEISRTSNRKINFIAAKKDDKEAAINKLRVLLQQEKIIIHPRCKTLIRHLKNVRWMKNKQKFARSPDNGHYDLVDAAVYLIRHMNFGENPYPFNYDNRYRKEDLFVSAPQNFGKPIHNYYSNNNSSIETFKKIFNVKPTDRGKK